MEEDVTRRETLHEERNALIQKMLDAKADGAKTQPAKGRGQRHYHCDTEDDEGR